MEYPNAPTGVGIQALIVRCGKVLLGKKIIGPGVGDWDLPGGFFSAPDRTLEETVVREVREETGCGVTKCEYYFSCVQEYGKRQILTVVFICEAEGDPEGTSEMADFKWVSEEIPLKTGFIAPKIALQKFFKSKYKNKK